MELYGVNTDPSKYLLSHFCCAMSFKIKAAHLAIPSLL